MGLWGRMSRERERCLGLSLFAFAFSHGGSDLAKKTGDKRIKHATRGRPRIHELNSLGPIKIEERENPQLMSEVCEPASIEKRQLF